MNTTNPTPNALLTPVQVAEMTGLAIQTLAARRSRGQAPAYLKVGSAVRYRAEAIEAWLQAGTVEPVAA